MDCLIGLKKIETNRVNLFFTSPPYAEQRKKTYGGINEANYINWFLPIAAEIKRALNDTGSFFLNIKEHSGKNGRSLYVFKLVQALCEDLGFILVDTFCWTKNPYPIKVSNKFKNGWETIYHFAKQPDISIYPESISTPIKRESNERAKKGGKLTHSSNGSGFGMTYSKNMSNRKISLPSNHIHINNVVNQYSDNRWHPATFPIALPTFFIKGFTQPGDLVVDPFAGSCTTLRASIREQRSFIGFETIKEYHQQSLLLINKEKKDFLTKKSTF
jgi:site-specific DNA-methyltransferase (adenine-specific)/site-specific DNA-methyltransferase (cytosine-N4-specific)